jgi:hypothetical protein
MAQRHPSFRGSVLVTVIAAVAIASMIVSSYLLFTDDHRERIAREDDDAATQIRLEQNVLRIQQEIRQLAKAKGEIDLSEISSYLEAPPNSQTSTEWLKLKLDGYEEGVALLESFATPSTSLTSLQNQGDPFLGAQANVLSVGVESSAATIANSQSRLSVKKVAVTPRIDVRAIPLSQFTVFAFGTSVDIDSVNFGDPIGRIYAQNDIRLSGSFSTNYPLVSGGNVYTTGSLTVSLDENPPIQFSGEQTAYAQPSDSSQAAWLAEARTQYNSAIINQGSLPISLSLPPAANGMVFGGTENKGPAFDLSTIRNRCDLFLLVRAEGRGKYGITVVRGNPSWLQSNGQHERGGAPAGSDSIESGEPPGTGWQNNPFVARKPKTNGRNEQVIVAFNYGALGQEARQQVHAIFVEFDSSISDAVVLVRGARTLQGGLTVASRWPVLVAGDFNAGPNPMPASILTTQTVRSVDANWGNTIFGSTH